MWLWCFLEGSRVDKGLLVAQNTFVEAEITLKVAVITSSLDKITFVVAEITFNVAVVTSSLLKNGSRECKSNNKYVYYIRLTWARSPACIH